MVFPTFFNLSLNLAIRSSWSEPQSAPNLVFADCKELLHLWLQRIYQSDFSIGHLVMSMCSLLLRCKRVFAMSSAFSWQNSVSLYSASFCTPKPNLRIYSRHLLTSYFCISVPYNEKDIFFGCWFYTQPYLFIHKVKKILFLGWKKKKKKKHWLFFFPHPRK